jgi:hypothetical protein
VHPVLAELKSFFVSIGPDICVDTHVAEGLAIHDPNTGYA